MDSDNVLYFKDSQEFRSWLAQNHQSKEFQWIGYYKKATKIPSMEWGESVDQALCYGWIDGLRKKVDEKRYKIRFTPRKIKSHWSAVNLKKMKILQEQGLMMPSGLEIFNKRDKTNSKKAGYEQGNIALDADYLALIKKNKLAWDYYSNKLAPSYKKISIHWIMSAKREDTRQKRVQILIDSCLENKKIPMLRNGKK